MRYTNHLPSVCFYYYYFIITYQKFEAFLGHYHGKHKEYIKICIRKCSSYVQEIQQKFNYIQYK